MHSRVLALLLVAIQGVVALVPVTLCGKCREFGGKEIGFAAIACEHCHTCCDEAAQPPANQNGSGEGATGEQHKDDCRAFAFGNPSAANEHRCTAIELEDGFAALHPRLIPQAADSHGCRLAVAYPSDGVHPAAGTSPLRC